MIKSYRIALLVVVIALALIGTSRDQAAGKPNSVLAFERLASLAGEWKGTQDGTDITLTYNLTADGSALMEEFRAGKTVMVSYDYAAGKSVPLPEATRSLLEGLRQP